MVSLKLPLWQRKRGSYGKGVFFSELQTFVETFLIKATPFHQEM